jgi:hypothetical protein
MLRAKSERSDSVSKEDSIDRPLREQQSPLQHPPQTQIFVLSNTETSTYNASRLFVTTGDTAGDRKLAGAKTLLQKLQETPLQIKTNLGISCHRGHSHTACRER